MLVWLDLMGVFDIRFIDQDWAGLVDGITHV